MNIKCYTLYDITRTNVNRKKFTDFVSKEEHQQRNQQSNLETIFQIINMRSQPEDISEVKKLTLKCNDIVDHYDFGYLYTNNVEDTKLFNIWEFSFTIEHPDVFNNGINELGNLITDCDQVPMIIDLEESFKLSRQLDTSIELCNIYFEIIR